MSDQNHTAQTPVEFRDVLRFSGYQVSNAGLVRTNLMRKKRTPLPDGQWRYLKRTPNAHGYIMVSLFQGCGQYRRYVHRLVLEAFVGPCPEGMECCHNDGNPANNCVENLRWDTTSANQLDREMHGTSNRGEQQGRSKLKDEYIPIIKKLYEVGVLQSQIAEAFGVHQMNVSCIVRGKTWDHIE